MRPSLKPCQHAQAWRRCSPSLAGFRGLRDPAVAEALGYTLHYGYEPCLIADSCDNQRDAITNLTRAISDRFRVEYHGVTSTAKGFDDFVQEVPIRRECTPCAGRFSRAMMLAETDTGRACSVLAHQSKHVD
jgi:hypothetical protein